MLLQPATRQIFRRAHDSGQHWHLAIHVCGPAAGSQLAGRHLAAILQHWHSMETFLHE